MICTPENLIQSAKCFKCIPAGMQKEIQAYLLAVIAGGSTDPNVLMAQAKCFRCIPQGEIDDVINYVICQIANTAQAGSSGISWSPDSKVVTWVDSNGNGSGNLAAFLATAMIPTVTQLTFPAGVTSISGLASLTGLFNVDYSATSVTSIDLCGLDVLQVLVTNGCEIIPTCAHLNMPMLNSITGNFVINNRPILTKITLGSLFIAMVINNDFIVTNCTNLSTFVFNTTVQTWFSASRMTITGCPALTVLDLRGNDQFGNGFDFSNNVNLVSILTRPLLDSIGFSFTCNGCKLNQTTVDLLLNDGVNSVMFGPMTINLAGGTNAHPSAAGLADKATLEGNGVVVTIN